MSGVQAIRSYNASAATSYAASSAVEKTSTPFSVYAAGVFRLGTGSFTVFSSIKELVGKPAIAPVDADKVKPLDMRVKNVFQRCVEQLRTFIISMKYHLMHGALFLGSGLCAVTGALHDLRLFNLGPALGILSSAESWTYLAGAVLGVGHFTEQYRLASILPENPTPEQLESSRRKKTSAVIGMIGCLAWVVNTAFILIGGLATVAFVIGLLATLTGFLKMLYDYFRPGNPAPAPAKA